MGRIVFYCRDERSSIDSFEYYKQDVDALAALGHEVVICTRYREIPRQFDAMFIWWWTYALWPVLLARVAGRPCLIAGVYNFRFPPTFHGVDYFGRPIWQRWLVAAATRLASLNLFIDETERRACAAHFGIETTRYFPCTVHEDYLQGPSSPRTTELFNIAWSGRQNLIRKGIPELLQAVRQLVADGLDVRLNLAGHRGDGDAFLVEMVRTLGLEDRVSLLGPLSRSEKIRRLRACDIYVQPSHYEGFGLAIAEAMGCGACVIVCNVGAVESVVGDCGVYVAPGSPTDLARTIKEVLQDGQLRQRLQGRAVARARAHFGGQQKVAMLRELLLETGIS